MPINQDYETFAQKTASKKAILAHLEPSQRLVLWGLDSGAIWKRIVDYYVIGVAKETAGLTEASSPALNSGEFYFEYQTKTLYVRLDNDGDPNGEFIVATYRLFFADMPFTLTWDLSDDGNEVEYEGVIESASAFKQELDNGELLGISLESEGSLTFKNKGGFFDPIFDRLFWDNKSCRIYSWFPDTPFSEARLIFQGEIAEDASYSQDKVQFRVRDFIYRLRQPINLDLFSDADGTISEDVSGVKYKRRLYGQTDGVRLQSLDQTLNGFNLAGTLAGSATNEVTVTGTGTLFLSELALGNKIEINGAEYEVIQIDSNISMVIRGNNSITDEVSNETFERIDFTALTGLLSGTQGFLSVTGSGTLFLSELTGGDEFRIDNQDYEVDTVTDNVNLTVTSNIQTTFNDKQANKLSFVTLTGTVSFLPVARIITGTGTDFLNEVSPGDEIDITDPFDTFTFRVDSVESATSLTVSEEIERNFSGIVGVNRPEIPYRKKNRKQFIAGHKLREPTTTITNVLQLNRFEMDVTDFFVNDTITIDGESARIKRISQNQVVLFQNLDTLPSIGATVSKNPIRAAYFNGRELLIDRDFTVTNNANESYITLTDLAEFNIVKPQKVIGTVSFVNNSRFVSGVGTSFETALKPRDWIRSNDVNHATWYEVLQVVDNSNLIIREPYGGANFSGASRRKSVTYVGDESIVTVDCIGKERNGVWIKTASDIILDLLETDAGLTNIDAASFAEAKIEADYIMSMKLPLSPNGSPQVIREIISLVNQSVFGSLIAKTNFQIAFNVLTPDRPNDLTEITDSDLIGAQNNFSVSTRSDVRRKITANYRHFDADVFTGEKGNAVSEFENTFVDYLIGTKNEKTVEVYLFNQTDADTIAERYGLIHSLKQNIVTVKAKLNLTLQNLNDKFFINLSRMFDRFGGSQESRKIGIISKIARGATQTTVTFSDLSNQFNRVGAISPDTAEDFTTAPDDEKIFNGYIVDDITELPDESATVDDQWNANLIG